MGRHHDGAFAQKIGWNLADPAAHRPLGGVRRKLGALRREMACIGPGSILSVHGSGVGYPVETIGEMDRDWLVPGQLGTVIESTVLVRYITI